jgi:hypothetical protein
MSKQGQITRQGMATGVMVFVANGTMIVLNPGHNHAWIRGCVWKMIQNGLHHFHAKRLDGVDVVALLAMMMMPLLLEGRFIIVDTSIITLFMT